MNKWTKIGKIKAIVIGGSFLINVLFPLRAIRIGVIEMLSLFVFGTIAVPLIIKGNNLFFSQVIEKPNWNENPFSFKRPLVMFQFGAYFSISIGISLLIGSILRFQSLQLLGINMLLFGLGVLAGIFLSLKLNENKVK